MVNLNDPRCQEFIEAVAACLVHLVQQDIPAPEKVQKFYPVLPIHKPGQHWSILDGREKQARDRTR